MPKTDIEIVIYYSRFVGDKHGAGVEHYIKDKLGEAAVPLGKGSLDISMSLLVKKWKGTELDHTGLAYALKQAQVASAADPTLLQNTADVAVLLFNSGELDACGRAVSFPAKGHAWAIAADDCSNATKHVLAHEVGHFFGGGHETFNGTPKYAHPYAYGYQSTIMDSQSEADPFLYSHPPDFGSYLYSNNTCVLRQTAPIISQYH